MPNSAERSQSMTTAIIMLVMIFTSIVGFGWLISKVVASTCEPKQTITKPVNK